LALGSLEGLGTIDKRQPSLDCRADLPLDRPFQKSYLGGIDNNRPQVLVLGRALPPFCIKGRARAMRIMIDGEAKTLATGDSEVIDPYGR
jgi:hypothetical protein